MCWGVQVEGNHLYNRWFYSWNSPRLGIVQTASVATKTKYARYYTVVLWGVLSFITKKDEVTVSRSPGARNLQKFARLLGSDPKGTDNGCGPVLRYAEQRREQEMEKPRRSQYFPASSDRGNHPACCPLSYKKRMPPLLEARDSPDCCQRLPEGDRRRGCLIIFSLCRRIATWLATPLEGPFCAESDQ